MGGFSLGELAGVLRLDDSQYKAALEESAAASALLTVNIYKIGDSVQALDKELRGAGFNLKEVQAYLNSLRAQGLDTASALGVLSSTIAEMQIKISNASAASMATVQRTVNAEEEAAASAVYAEQARIAALMKRAAVEDKLDIDARRRVAEMLARDQAAVIEIQQTEAAALKQREALEASAAARRSEILVAETKEAESLFAQEAAAFAESTAVRTRLEAGAATRRTEILAAELARAEAMYVTENAANAAASAGGIGMRLGVGSGGIRPHGYVSGGGMIAAGIAAFGGYEMVKQASEFETALAKVKAVIGDVSDAMSSRMSAAALGLSEKFGYSAKSIVQEFATMSKAEVDFEQQFRTLPVLVEFARATNTELDKSAKLVLTVMNTLKIPFDEINTVTNQFVLANRMAIGSVDDFAKAIEGRAGAAFRASKTSLSDALAMTVVFARAGVEANISQTALTQTVTKMTTSAIKHGEVLLDVSGKQIKWRDIVYNSNGELNKMSVVFQALDKAFTGQSTQKITAFFNAIGLSGQRDVYVKSLLGMGQALEDVSAKMDQVSGQRAKSLAEAMKAPTVQFEKAKEAIRNAGIELGASLLPIAIRLAGMFSDVAKSIKAITDMVHGDFKSLKATAPYFEGKQLPTMGGLASDGSTITSRDQYIDELKAYSDAALAYAKKMSSASSITQEAVSREAYAKSLAAKRIAASLKEQIEAEKEAVASRAGGTGAPTDNPLFTNPYDDLKLDAINDKFATFAQKLSATQRYLTEAQKSSLDAGMAGLQDLINNNAPEKALNGKLNSLISELNRYKAALATKKAELREALQQVLGTEAVRETFVRFSDQYGQLVDKLSNEQQEVISAGMSRVQEMLSGGEDKKLVLAAMKSLEDDLKRFKADAAVQDKAESIQLAKENAADQVNAFKERYLDDLRAFAPGVRDVMSSVMGALDSSLADGDVKRTAEVLREAGRLYNQFQKEVDAAARVQKNLTESFSKTSVQERRDEKRKPEFISLSDRVNPFILQATDAARPLVGVGTQVELAMRRMGLTSEFSLNLAAKAASGLYSELLTLKPPTDEAREAWLSARSAFIRADEGLKPLHDDFVRVREELDRIKAQGNISDRITDLTNLQIRTKALDWSTNGLGNTYRDLWKTFESSFGQIGGVIVDSIADIDHFTKHWTDAGKAIAKSIATDILGSLLKIAAAKILIAIGIGVDPATAKQSQSTAATVALSNEVRLSTDATVENTVSEDANTAALNRLTAMLEQMQSAQSGGVLGSLLGLIPGFGTITGLGAAAGGAGGLSGTFGVGSFDVGGFIPRTQLAKVHAGEYVMTPRLTAGLTDMINGGGGSGDSFNFAGAHFGPSLTPADMREIMTGVVGKLRRVGTRTKTGKL